jgi:pimeloyl-ACP methyl ester carboxylesterase
LHARQRKGGRAFMAIPNGFAELPVEAGGARLNAAFGPSGGPPLLFLHGVTRRWQTFLPIAAAVAGRWQVQAVDFCGHGASERAGGRYHVVDYVDSIADLVARQAREPVVIYGHSLGAMVAAGVAARLPDAVRACVLEDPPFETMGRRIFQSRLISFFRGIDELVQAGFTQAELTRRLPELRTVDPLTNAVERLGDVRDAASLRFTASCLARLDPAVLKPIVAGAWLEGYDWQAVVAGMRCPALVMQADQAAGGMLTDDDARWVAAHLRDGALVRYVGAPHLIHWARSQELANHVLAFLESIR